MFNNCIMNKPRASWKAANILFTKNTEHIFVSILKTLTLMTAFWLERCSVFKIHLKKITYHHFKSKAVIFFQYIGSFILFSSSKGKKNGIHDPYEKFSNIHLLFATSFQIVGTTLMKKIFFKGLSSYPSEPEVLLLLLLLCDFWGTGILCFGNYLKEKLKYKKGNNVETNHGERKFNRKIKNMDILLFLVTSFSFGNYWAFILKIILSSFSHEWILVCEALFWNTCPLIISVLGKKIVFWSLKEYGISISRRNIILLYLGAALNILTSCLPKAYVAYGGLYVIYPSSDSFELVFKNREFSIDSTSHEITVNANWKLAPLSSPIECFCKSDCKLIQCQLQFHPSGISIITSSGTKLIVFSSVNSTTVSWQSAEGEFYGEFLIPAKMSLVLQQLKMHPETFPDGSASLFSESNQVGISESLNFNVPSSETLMSLNSCFYKIESYAASIWSNILNFFPEFRLFPTVMAFSDQSFSETKHKSSQNHRFLQNNLNLVVEIAPEIIVNSDKAFKKSNPKIAVLKNFNFIIAWNSFNQDYSSGSSEGLEGVYLQLYSPNFNSIGSEVLVNEFQWMDQNNHIVTPLANGNFVVVWESYQDTFFKIKYDIGVYGKIYKNNGEVAISEKRINDEIDLNQAQPQSASLSNGNFAVVWSSAEQDKSGLGVYGKILNQKDNSKVKEFQINSYTKGDQSNPRIAALNNEAFLVIWSSSDQDGSGLGISGQIFSLEGLKIEKELQINSFTAGNQSGAEMASLRNNPYFIIVWASPEQDGSGLGVYGQIVDAKGKLISQEFRVNTYFQNDQTNPRIAAFKNGNFVVIWMSFGQDGSDWGIFGQVFAFNGKSLCSEFRVNTFSNKSQSSHQITVLENDYFVVVWESEGQNGVGIGVYSQIFNPFGEKFGSEFPVSSFSTPNQKNPQVAASANSVFIVAWNGLKLDGTEGQIYRKVFSMNRNIYNINHMAVSASAVISSKQDPKSCKIGTDRILLVWQNYNGFQSVIARIINSDTSLYGNELLISNDISTNNINSVAIPLKNGGCLIAWQKGLDAEKSIDIRARVVSEVGALGAETKISSGYSNGRPDVACLKDGSLVFVWERYTDPGLSSGIFGQLFSSSLDKIGVEFQIGGGRGVKKQPKVAALESGNFIITWLEENTEKVLNGQLYTSDGNILSKEFSISGFDIGAFNPYAIAPRSDGGFVAVWQRESKDFNRGLYFQIISSTGSKIGAERPCTATQTTSFKPSVTVLGNDSFVVSWEKNHSVIDSIFDKAESSDIISRSFSSSGYPLEPETLFDCASYGVQKDTNLLALSADYYLLAWSSNLNTTNWSFDFDTIFVGSRQIGKAKSSSASINLLNEFRYSSDNDSDLGSFSQAAADKNVILSTWHRKKAGGKYSVFARGIWRAGEYSFKKEIEIDQYTFDDAFFPTLSTNGKGEALLIWQTKEQDGSGLGVYARLIKVNETANESGLDLMPEFRVPQASKFDQQTPKASYLINDKWLAVWSSDQNSKNRQDIYARIIAGNTADAKYEEFLVNSFVTDDQKSPSIAALSNGIAIVVWESINQDGQGLGIFARFIDSEGKLLGEDFQINSHHQGDQSSPHVCVLKNGNIVVVWKSFGQDGDGTGIYFQQLANNGSYIGPESLANSFTKGDQMNPFVASVSDDRYVIAWVGPDYWDPAKTSAFAQLFSNAGGKIGSEIFLGQNITHNYTTAQILTFSKFTILFSGEASAQKDLGMWLYGQLAEVPYSEAEVYPSKYAEFVIYRSRDFNISSFKDSFQTDKKYWPINYSIETKSIRPPDWLSLDPSTLCLKGNPKDANPANFTVEILATNAAGVTASMPFTINLKNNPPLATKRLDSLETNINANFSYTFPEDIFYDEDSDTIYTDLRLMNSSVLPRWLKYFFENKTMAGVPPTGSQGYYYLKYIGADRHEGEASLALNLTVLNRAPEGKIIQVPVVQPVGTKFTFFIPANTFTDPDGDSLIYSAFRNNNQTNESLPDWIKFSSKELSFTILPVSGCQGDTSLQLVATDPFGGSAHETFKIKILNAEIVIKKPLPNHRIQVGSTILYNIPNTIFEDPDKDSLSYTAKLENGSPLPAWLKLEDGIFFGNPTKGSQGEYTIIVTADDNYGSKTSSTFKITVLNTPPVASILPTQKARVGVPYGYKLDEKAFYDADGDELTFSAKGNSGERLPDWLQFFQNNNSFYGIPKSGSQGFKYIRIFARDPFMNETSTTLVVEVQNSNPTAFKIDDKIAFIGKLFEYSLSGQEFSDPDGDKLTLESMRFDGSPLPEWLTFDPLAGKFSGLPKSGHQGKIDIRLTADDGFGGSTSIKFTLTVENAKPVCKKLENLSVYIGSKITHSLNIDAFQDPDGDKLTLEASKSDGSPLPAWLNFDAERWTFSGTPQSGSQGGLDIAVIASDNFGKSVSCDFKINIQNRNPKANTLLQNKISSFVGQPFTYIIPEDAFIDPDGDILTYNAYMESGLNLPQWVSFNQEERLFSGIPVTGSQGNYNISVIAKDYWGGKAKQTFIISIPNRSIVTRTIPDQTFTLNSYFFYQIPNSAFISEDGNLLYLKAFLCDGAGSSLPSWINFSDSGTFSGIPPKIETLHILVDADDKKGGKASLDFFINISQTMISKTIPKLVGVIPDQLIKVGERRVFSLPNDVFSSNLTLSFVVTLINDDPLPPWFVFSPHNNSFIASPAKGDHLFNKTRVAVEARNIFGENAKTSFALEFDNTPPKTSLPVIEKVLLIKQEYTIFISILDEDGDPVTCSFLGKPPAFLQLDPGLCKILCSPKSEDYDRPVNMGIIAFDNFGGNTTISLKLAVQFSSYDNFMRWFKFLLPIVSGVGGAFAAYQKKALIWNILAFWSRPYQSKWYINKIASHNILPDYLPGWFGKVLYNEKITSSAETFKDPLQRLKFFFLKYVLCNLLDKSPEIPSKEIRLVLLRNTVVKVAAVSRGLNGKILKFLPFLDFLLNRQLPIRELNICWKDASLNMNQNLKNNILSISSSKEQIEIYVWAKDGRLLQKIICVTAQPEEDSFIRNLNLEISELRSPVPETRALKLEDASSI